MTGNPSGSASSAGAGPNVGGNPSGSASSASSTGPNVGGSPSRLQRTVALFPGAFRPPHINHYETVRRLADRKDVDEIVILVSRRSRRVPETELALDVDVARAVWNIYLRNLDGVRVEIAAGSAVAAATDLVRVGRPGDRFLLVFGDPDLAVGRKRFGKTLRCLPAGVEASVERGAPNPRPVRATELRAFLGRGDEAFESFRQALPDDLTVGEQWQVWATCRSALVDGPSLVASTIDEILATNGLEPTGQIVPAGRTKTDQVYRAKLGDGSPVFIKCAFDAVKDSPPISTASSAGVDARKPRRRLKAEREALKWLHRHLDTPVVVPDVVCYDKTARTLVLSGVCDGGRRLGDDLRAGAAAPAVAHLAGRFLASAHDAQGPVGSFWDDRQSDVRYWHAALTILTTAPDWWSDVPFEILDGLRRLAEASAAAAGPGYCHLDYSTDNLLYTAEAVGLIDFEHSTTFGDPAFDLGTQLGHYVAAGFGHLTPGDGQAMIRAAVEGYCSLNRDLWAENASRVAAITGATALQLLWRREGERVLRPSTTAFAVCTRLLSLLGESDQAVVRTSLIDCLAEAGGNIAGKTTRDVRMVRRWSLMPLNSLGLWEGWLVDHTQSGTTTVVVHGGRPRSLIDIHIDGVWVAAATLDSIGSATASVPAAPSFSLIEIFDSDAPVLGRSVSLIQQGT